MVLEIVKAVLGRSGPPLHRGVRRWGHGGLPPELAARFPRSTELLAEMLAGGVVERAGVSPWRWGWREGITAATAGATHLALRLIVQVGA